MQYKLTADENVHAGLISALRQNNVEVLSIRERNPGISDLAVMDMARETGSILITEDSDFGELVFSYGVASLGIVYLRYHFSELQQIVAAVTQVLSSYDLTGHFCVITPQKIRIRKLPDHGV